MARDLEGKGQSSGCYRGEDMIMSGLQYKLRMITGHAESHQGPASSDRTTKEFSNEVALDFESWP